MVLRCKDAPYSNKMFFVVPLKIFMQFFCFVFCPRMETEMGPLTSWGQIFGLQTLWTHMGRYLIVLHTYYAGLFEALDTINGFWRIKPDFSAAIMLSLRYNAAYILLKFISFTLNK